MNILRKIFNPRVVRAIRLVFLAEVLSIIYTGDISLSTTGMLVADAKANNTGPVAAEMPWALVPVLVIMSFAALCYIRKMAAAPIQPQN